MSMNKGEMLEAIEERLNVVNKGLFKPEDFHDDYLEEITEFYKMVTARGDISPREQSAIIEELSKLRK